MNPIQIDHFYKIDETLLKCVKTRESGCNLFHVVDGNGNHVVKHDQKQPGLITDHGQRLIYNRINELIEVQLPVQQNIKIMIEAVECQIENEMQALCIACVSVSAANGSKVVALCRSG